jgi:hypothetical protein
MTAYTMNCPPIDCGPCGTLPSGFVRLRYFYGKRLGVADLVDEQRYHSGKLRFHQQRLHGSGVLCGLRVEPFSAEPADATILRVRRGAAVDGCGRDIIVGYDQCIDLDAWLGKQLERDPDFLTNAADPADPTKLPLCVVLRYRECPSHPEPAPRDPCSCEAGGCDYGRVREEFELDLIARPTQPIVPPIFPPRDKLGPAIGAAAGGPAIVERIAALAHDACPAPDSEGWLELACFVATLTPPATPGPGSRTHITAFASLEMMASILYETALLQELLLRSTAATMQAGSLADGPQIDEVALDDPTAPTSLILSLTAPVLASTVPPGDIFVLYVLDPANGWSTAITTTTTYDATGTGRFIVQPPANTLAEGALLRLMQIEPSPSTPMVDGSMRPLRPLNFSFHFTMIKDPNDATKLVIAPPPIVP